jgi:predicted SprT family Zn-dependent metalloprotease
MNRIEDAFYSAYKYFNKTLFGGKLPACIITIREAPKSLGYFSPKRFTNGEEKIDEIALNSHFFNSRSIDETFSTLGHEMAHLWQANFGTPGRGKYHNMEWAEKMESIGLLPTATGIIGEGQKKTGDHVTHAIDPNGKFRQMVDAYLTGKNLTLWGDVFSMGCFNVTRYNFDKDYRDQIDRQRAAEGDDEGEGEGEGQGSAGKRRQTRARYTCECDSHIWAKPGLSIRCNECGKDFLED